MTVGIRSRLREMAGGTSSELWERVTRLKPFLVILRWKHRFLFVKCEWFVDAVNELQSLML